MAKSIHERVRAALEKKEREDRRAAGNVQDSAMRKAIRADEQYELGCEAHYRGEFCPMNASREFKRGYKAAYDAETAEVLGEA